MKMLRLRRKKPPVVNPIREMGTKTWSAADDSFKDMNSRRQAMKASFAKYWDEPARPERKKMNPNVATAAGATALGAAAGVGGAMLLTRGKGTKTIKTVTRTVKVKGKATKPPKPEAPKPDAPTEPDIPLTTPRPSREQIGRQRKMSVRRIDEVQAQRAETAPIAPDPRVKAPVEYDSKLSMQEVNAAADAKYGKPEDFSTPEPVDLGPAARRAARRANAQKHGKQGQNPRPNKFGKALVRKSADPSMRIFKALTGEKGDKRNTKYALAGGAGYVVGVQTGMHLGARAAGTTFKENRAEATRKIHNFSEKERAKVRAAKQAETIKVTNAMGRTPLVGKVPPSKVVDPDKWTPKMKDINRVNNSVKGSKALVRGGTIGAVAGTAAGLGLYGAYRADKKKRTVMI